MDIFPNGPGHQPRIMLLGGTSEIGLAILGALGAPEGAEVILAGRDEQRLAAAGKELPYRVRTAPYDAIETGGHQAFTDAIFAEGPLDMVISAAGILVPQEEVERDVRRAAEMIETNFTGHGTGVRVVLVRPGFVTGRMTAGMAPAPLATTPEQVGKATAAALRGGKTAVWIPAPLGGLAVALRLVPRPAWRRVSK